MIKKYWRFGIVFIGIIATLIFFYNQIQKKITYQLVDSTNKVHLSKQYQDKLVLINYWATWCPPCIREIPALVDFQKKYKKQVQVLGINYDREDFHAINAFIKKMPFNYPIFLQKDNDFSQLGNISGLPTTLIIKNNKIVKTHSGELFAEDFEKLSNQYIKTQ